MKRTGGIILFIAGLLGVIPSAVTFFQSLFAERNDSTVESLVIGGAGVIISLMMIIFGAIAFRSNSKVHNKVPGIIIIIISIVAMMGWGLALIFPILALAGGILIVIGDNKKISPQPIH
jgi:hypothetical protein